MHTPITQQQAGLRISELRKLKGLSQQELADKINMSRPSLAQLELGNRSIDIFELEQLAMVLGFSIDRFMSAEFSPETVPSEKTKQKKQSERIAVPTLQIAKLKNVLLYILEKCAGKPNVGETVLYKLLYFADFNYYEQYEEHLTGAKYRKLPYGPVPAKLDTIIAQMAADGELQRVKTKYHGHTQTRYLPLQRANLMELKASEKETLDRVIEQMGDWSATAISDYSHKDMPWLASKEGEDINYELVFYRDSPFSVRTYSDSE
ncbi:MAG: type II toxin-antitoxin system antitoxin SocA domain-containing protein [Bacteroidota bacterium]